jgi:heme-degrading monooxygenase HmoA
MFMNLSNFIPKSGHEAEFLDYFENNILPITFAAEGLVSAEVVVSEDGQITNLERWESKEDWEALVREITEGEGNKERMEMMNSLGEDWWERHCREVRRLKD